MEFPFLIEGLMKALGCEGRHLADEGAARLGVGDTAIDLLHLPETQELLITSRLGAVPQVGADRLREAMLRANFVGRAAARGALSQSEDGGIYLQRVLSLPHLDVDGLMNALDVFVAVAVEWAENIARCNAGEAIKPPDELPAGGGLAMDVILV